VKPVILKLTEKERGALRSLVCITVECEDAAVREQEASR
jgi:hypothetical protein